MSDTNTQKKQLKTKFQGAGSLNETEVAEAKSRIKAFETKKW
jgi:hypothetical protein